MAHHLLDEERIALCLLVDGPHEPRGRLVTGVGGNQCADAVLVEAFERDALEQPVAAKVGKQLGKGVLGADLRFPVRVDDQQRRFARLF